MTRKRGFTLTELMIAMSMMTVLVGAVTSVYAYTIQRLGYSLASYTTQRETEYGLDTIDHVITVAQVCTQVTINGNVCLKCTLPANCVTTNTEGTAFLCGPNTINRRSLERWGNGNRVWFFLSDSTGTPSNLGSILWMASRSDDATPTGSDDIQAFTYYPGGSRARLDLLQSFTTSSASTSNLSHVVIVTGSNTNADTAAPNTTSTSTSYQPSISRTPYERGWRY